ncbi:MAG: glycosyltransferase family 2 protein [Vibrionaceae bacterium]|nr:glycosyltransferase family 2 protein [Vibrionaceae bacterium]
MLISIVIPAYNVEKYIADCLRSILENEFVEKIIEVIVVDDGSSDKTLVECEKFTKLYKNLKVFSQANAGQSSARNKGIDESAGKYIWFIDSDDYLASGAIPTVVENLLTLPDIDMLAFNGDAFIDGSFQDSNSMVEKLNYRRPTIDQELVTSYELFKKSIEQGKYFVQPCHYICKKSIVNDVRFKEGVIYEDNLFTTIALSKCKNVRLIEDSLYNRRLRPNSTTTKNYSRRNSDSFLIILDELLNVRKEVVSCLPEKSFDCYLKSILVDTIYMMSLVGGYEYKSKLSTIKKVFRHSPRAVFGIKIIILMFLSERMVRFYKNAKNQF